MSAPILKLPIEGAPRGTTRSELKTLTGDRTLGELADLEDRANRGEQLPAEEARALDAARTIIRPAAEAARRALRPLRQVSQEAQEAIRRVARKYERESAWVDSLPAHRRARYMHIPLADLRRERLREEAAARIVPLPTWVRTRESHRQRPGHRRSGATSTTAGSDPGGSDSDADSWPGGFSFRDFDQLVSSELPGPARLAAFCGLREQWQREAWLYERYVHDLQWAVRS